MEDKNFNTNAEVAEEQFALMIIDAAEKEIPNQKKKFNMDALAKKIAEKFFAYKDKAIDMLKDAKKLDEFLEKVGEHLKKYGDAGRHLAYIPEMMMLVRSYAIGEYKDITLQEIVAIIAALMYFVSPVDILPDILPGLGMLDDILVMEIVIGWCNKSIDKYMEWRKK